MEDRFNTTQLFQHATNEIQLASEKCHILI
jgi:hypothetical protein